MAPVASGPGHDGHGDHRGPGLFEHLGGLATCGAGGQDVVDQQDASILNGVGPAHMKRAPNVFQPASRR